MTKKAIKPLVHVHHKVQTFRLKKFDQFELVRVKMNTCDLKPKERQSVTANWGKVKLVMYCLRRIFQIDRSLTKSHLLITTRLRTTSLFENKIFEPWKLK